VNKKSIIIGYSGHAFVVIDTFHSSSSSNMFTGYCDSEEKSKNPFNLIYLGMDSQKIVEHNNWFVGIGNNQVREKIISKYHHNNLLTITHYSCIISEKASIGKGSFISAKSTVNAFANLGLGVIVNTGAVIEHECTIDNFVHIAPGAVLAGNVSVGKRSFVGANAVVKQGVSIGQDVVIGAGSVIISDVPSGLTVVGNPGKIIKRNK
jgi:acetyltransferase EpsM